MFRLVGIDHQQFEPIFALSERDLRQHHAVRRVATSSPGFPCRISLEDAGVGDELLLLPYPHQPAASPYRSSGPIYIRRGATQRTLATGVVPDYVTSRLISVRAYDRRGKRIEVMAGGFTARVIQHETDHLDGVLFFDRMRSFQTLTFLDEYGRYWSGPDSDPVEVE